MLLDNWTQINGVTELGNEYQTTKHYLEEIKRINISKKLEITLLDI